MAIEDEGVSQKKAVKIFRVSQSGIMKWVKIYWKKGFRGLKKKKQGRPKESGKLEGGQAASL